VGWFAEESDEQKARQRKDWQAVVEESILRKN